MSASRERHCETLAICRRLELARAVFEVAVEVFAEIENTALDAAAAVLVDDVSDVAHKHSAIRNTCHARRVAGAEALVGAGSMAGSRQHESNAEIR